MMEDNVLRTIDSELLRFCAIWGVLKIGIGVHLYFMHEVLAR